MATAKDVPPRRNPANLFAGAFGAFIGLALLKFGNPPVMEHMISPPQDGYEFLLGTPWPITWAHMLLAGLVVFALIATRDAPCRPLATPQRLACALVLGWFAWVCVSAFSNAGSGRFALVTWHFAACVVCFFLGLKALSRADSLVPFWSGIAAGFVLMLVAGWSQHFGGLDRTRQYFFTYLYPQMREVPPEYFKKISSNRIFGTQFYPNTLAGALLLFTPPLLWFAGTRRVSFSPGARALLVGLLMTGVAGCLLWSGSKGGWLLMLTLVLLFLLRSPLPRRMRIALLAVCVVAGGAGFAWRYAGFFQRGATSVGARFDYWSAGLRIAKANPINGTGPGTFGTEYQKIKRPESESARLAHNDYLQQASDSGVLAALAYAGFVGSALWFTRPRKVADPRETDDQADGQMMRFWVWLGVFGWAMHNAIEFVLYIPALAWPAFALLGWLLARDAHPGHANIVRPRPDA